MTQPVSIVVPHQKSRSSFFRRYCLPSIEANHPAQVLIQDEDGEPCAKRNKGAFFSTQPYILFVDDDTILAADCLGKMVAVLEENPQAGYAYSDFVGVSWPGVIHPQGPNFLLKSREFDAADLRKFNYIDTTSLVRRCVFPRFDPRLERFQDWDLWLGLLDRGITGLYIDDVLFFKFAIDQGISARVPAAPAMKVITEKHRLD